MDTGLEGRDRVLRIAGATPPPEPLDMPDQDLRSPPLRRMTPGVQGWRTRLARFVAFGGAAALTVVAIDQMIRTVAVGDPTVMQIVLIGMFALNFAWIALSATSAVAGLLPLEAGPSGRPEGEPGRCALAMPVYNEDPARTTAALLAMARDLADLGEGERFEIFVLSDTTDPMVWARETAAMARLRDRLDGRMAVWYRHRQRNVDRKAGNVRDFVERWGGRYETMLVLDADSLMSAETIRALRDGMAADPALGLLQSVPALAGMDSLFARLQQFAARIAGPVVSRGLAAWQGDDGNYWGHNAIIRTRAFAEACGLPRLPGRLPFGGSILSHDFVEAALMRRAGWKVRMAAELGGSWETSPASLLDSGARDRRWAQGNMQHLAVIGARGLGWCSRAHLATGVMSYLSSLLWLGFIVVGLVLLVQAQALRPKYFTEAFQLFPTWPRFDSERMVWLFVFTMATLLVPKTIGLLRAMLSRAHVRSVGDAVRLLAGWLVEILVSALFAPIMMLIHSRHVWEILLGQDTGWKLQRRDDGAIPLREAAARHAGHTVVGIAVAGALLPISMIALAWLAPILIGWTFAIPLSIASGSVGLGLALRRFGLLLIPEERDLPPLLKAAAEERDAVTDDLAGVSLVGLLDTPEGAERHFLFAGQRWHWTRGSPDTDYLTLNAKLADAETREQALGWLRPTELLRLLGDRRAFDTLRGLPSVVSGAAIAGSGERSAGPRTS
ncbi:glucans biosynthesis glucosyltransferase MdoH [Thalassobaculum sp.]|uniref:glucans biosynthesis glucosyltransferase MdoH n=1 Tax=Thalassobaculum sp. TaxID=2022740 RepID=UPI0032ECD0DD